MLSERSSSEETKIALKGAVLVSLGRQDKREERTGTNAVTASLWASGIVETGILVSRNER